MKKIAGTIVLFVVFVAALWAASAVAAVSDKPPSPPGQGECEHGNSGKPCKDDPQPEHGKDCEEHGPKNGGVNEDHCKGEETTTDETTTDETTTDETTTDVTTTTEEPKCSDCPQPTVPETTPEPPSTTPSEVTPPSTQKPGVKVTELEDELEEQAASNGATASGSGTHVQSTDALPYTGLALNIIVLLGALLATTGLWLRGDLSRFGRWTMAKVRR